MAVTLVTPSVMVMVPHVLVLFPFVYPAPIPGQCFGVFLKLARVSTPGKIFFFVKILALSMDNAQSKLQYLTPECEVYELVHEDLMTQHSYHYMGGPDD